MTEKPSMPIVFKQFVVESTHDNFHLLALLSLLQKPMERGMCTVRELDIDEVIYRP